ncbi:MAG: DUF2842 domain-containing protein [Siculibacillus sp.]
MSSATRRIIGNIALVVFLLVYVFFALAVGDVIAASNKSGIVQFFYFLVAGLLWVLPAGALVKWMYARRDPPVG